MKNIVRPVSESRKMVFELLECTCSEKKRKWCENCEVVVGQDLIIFS